MVSSYPLRRNQLIAQSGVDRELVGDLQIVLNIEEVHHLVVVDDDKVVQRVAAARAHQKIGQVRRFFNAGVAAAGIGADVGIGRAGAEAAAIVVVAIGWIEVVDLSIDGLKLVANLDAVAAVQKRVVDLGIDCKWVLKLRIAALRAKLREAGDGLVVEGARDERRSGQARNACLHNQAGQTETVGGLATQGPGEGDARIENGVLAEQEGVASRDLLVVVMNRAVGVSARRTGKGFGVLNIEVVPAPAEEGRRARIQEEVEARVGLVIGEVGLGNIDQVIGEAACTCRCDIRRRQMPESPALPVRSNPIEEPHRWRTQRPSRGLCNETGLPRVSVKMPWR